MTGIEYPTFQADGRALVVRFSAAAQILVRRAGLNPLDLKPALDPQNPESTENWLKLFAAMVDENYCDLSDPHEYKLGAGPSSDYWASIIAPEDLRDLCQVCNDAMGKVWAALRERQRVSTPAAA